MTKDEIELIVKRHRYVDKAIKENLNKTEFYIGNRKQIIEITNELIVVYEIIEEIRESTTTKWIRKMIDGVLNGDSDIWLITHLPCERSMFYNVKGKFIDNIYHCCIAKGLISYEYLLKEGIA